MEKVKALNLIGIAYRAKKIVNGYESVMATVTSGKAKCVIVASDASSKTIEAFSKKCYFYHVPMYMDFNTDEGLNGGKYPICCWNSDAFTNWMTANSVNTYMGVAGGVGTMALGAVAMASGAGALLGVSMILGGATAIGTTIGQVHQASMQPDQVKGNTNCGDVITGSGHNTFMFFNMSIKQEYAKIIDGYFDMFGYKVCRVKAPNKAHRSRYWYTKTIDVNIDGAIPNKDMQVIKEAYNNGITFWRNGNEIGNYSLSNNIV